MKERKLDAVEKLGSLSHVNVTRISKKANGRVRALPSVVDSVGGAEVDRTVTSALRLGSLV